MNSTEFPIDLRGGKLNSDLSPFVIPMPFAPVSRESNFLQSSFFLRPQGSAHIEISRVILICRPVFLGGSTDNNRFY